MHTLKSLRDALITLFQTNATYLGVPVADIAKGRKDGLLPQSAPCIWVYAEPYKPRQNERARTAELKGTLAIFVTSLGKAEPASEADDEAIQLCERCDQLILNNAENLFIRYTEESYVHLDGTYSNYSSAFITYDFSYISSAQ